MSRLQGMKLRTAARHLLIVDRERFRLDHYTRTTHGVEFDRGTFYPIAVGMQGVKTPRGLYLINTKARCPDWLVPDSDWARDAGLEPGTVVPGCTDANPLKARWLGVSPPEDGIGIHGTDAESSIGTAASHGCIRMRVPDVIELFDQVPKGTPIFIF